MCVSEGGGRLSDHAARRDTSAQKPSGGRAGGGRGIALGSERRKCCCVRACDDASSRGAGGRGAREVSLPQRKWHERSRT